MANRLSNKGRDANPTKGAIFHLPKVDESNNSMMEQAGLHADAMDHPVLVLHSDKDSRTAIVLVVTSLDGRTLRERFPGGKKKARKNRGKYLPLAPTNVKHPDNGKLLTLNDPERCSMPKRSFVKLRSAHKVSWDLIHPFRNSSSVSFKLDDASLLTLESALPSAVKQMIPSTPSYETPLIARGHQYRKIRPPLSPPPVRSTAPPPARVAAPPPARVAAPPPVRVAAPPPVRVAAPLPARVATPSSSGTRNALVPPARPPPPTRVVIPSASTARTSSLPSQAATIPRVAAPVPPRNYTSNNRNPATCTPLAASAIVRNYGTLPNNQRDLESQRQVYRANERRRHTRSERADPPPYNKPGCSDGIYGIIGALPGLLWKGFTKVVVVSASLLWRCLKLLIGLCGR